MHAHWFKFIGDQKQQQDSNLSCRAFEAFNTLTAVTKVKPQKDDVIREHEESEYNNNHSKNLHDLIGFFLLVALKHIVWVGAFVPAQIPANSTQETSPLLKNGF